MVRPAWSSALDRVFGLRMTWACTATVTRPGLVGCFSCMWPPTWWCSNQPSLNSARKNSAAVIRGKRKLMVGLCYHHSPCPTWLSEARSATLGAWVERHVERLAAGGSAEVGDLGVPVEVPRDPGRTASSDAHILYTQGLPLTQWKRPPRMIYPDDPAWESLR
ncbi:MAG: hypothetical protein HW416_2496 [Chloroflexi bacterium]|nr:hypothetical protein [Chloroflexota bacterium]